MSVNDKDLEKINLALRNIQTYKNKERVEDSSNCWQLDIPVWQLALEGIVAFLIAFISGKGLGIMFQVLFG